MSNRVIKVSIILIFMLFVTGLFNFCFASGLDFTVGDNIFGDFNMCFANFEFDLINSSNAKGSPTNLSYFKVNNIDSYSKIYAITDNAPNNLYCVVSVYDKFLSYNNSSGYSVCYNNSYNDKGSSTMNIIYKYDFTNKVWNNTGNNSVYVELNTVGHLYNIIYSENVYWYSSSIYNEDTLLYSSDMHNKPPTNEELINNFDFDVKLIFEPGNDDVPNSSKYVFRNGYDCLVEHTLNNWDDYIVTLDIELSSYTGMWLKSFSFDYYDSSHNLKFNNEKIKEKVSLNVLKEEYYSIKTAANDSDNVILTYNIYSKYTNEFLYKRVIKFCFDKGKWWDVFSKSTGNIISDEIYSVDGDIVNNENNDLSSNGTILNKPVNNYDFDNLYSLDKDTLHTNVSDLITDSANFFDLFSLFLLMLPGWISSLLYLFLFGIIVITLLRFIRGA